MMDGRQGGVVDTSQENGSIGADGDSGSWDGMADIATTRSCPCGINRYVNITGPSVYSPESTAPEQSPSSDPQILAPSPSLVASNRYSTDSTCPTLPVDSSPLPSWHPPSPPPSPPPVSPPTIADSVSPPVLSSSFICSSLCFSPIPSPSQSPVQSAGGDCSVDERSGGRSHVIDSVLVPPVSSITSDDCIFRQDSRHGSLECQEEVKDSVQVVCAGESMEERDRNDRVILPKAGTFTTNCKSDDEFFDSNTMIGMTKHTSDPAHGSVNASDTEDSLLGGKSRTMVAGEEKCTHRPQNHLNDGHSRVCSSSAKSDSRWHDSSVERPKCDSGDGSDLCDCCEVEHCKSAERERSGEDADSHEENRLRVSDRSSNVAAGIAIPSSALPTGAIGRSTESVSTGIGEDSNIDATCASSGSMTGSVTSGISSMPGDSNMGMSVVMSSNQRLRLLRTLGVNGTGIITPSSQPRQQLNRHTCLQSLPLAASASFPPTMSSRQSPSSISVIDSPSASTDPSQSHLLSSRRGRSFSNTFLDDGDVSESVSSSPLSACPLSPLSSRSAASASPACNSRHLPRRHHHQHPYHHLSDESDGNLDYDDGIRGKDANGDERGGTASHQQRQQHHQPHQYRISSYHSFFTGRRLSTFDGGIEKKNLHKTRPSANSASPHNAYVSFCHTNNGKNQNTVSDITASQNDNDACDVEGNEFGRRKSCDGVEYGCGNRQSDCDMTTSSRNVKSNNTDNSQSVNKMSSHDSSGPNLSHLFTSRGVIDNSDHHHNSNSQLFDKVSPGGSKDICARGNDANSCDDDVIAFQMRTIDFLSNKQKGSSTCWPSSIPSSATDDFDFRLNYLKKLSYANVWIPNSRKPPQHQTVVIFDWDDTILCTSYINYREQTALAEAEHQRRQIIGDSADGNNTVNENLIDIINPHFQKQLDTIQDHAIILLELAMKLGQVFIITNAMQGWVQYSSQRYLPRLVPILEKLPVISARNKFEAAYPEAYHEWKIQAFLEVQRQLNSQIITNLISVGDSNIEMDAVHVMGKKWIPSANKGRRANQQSSIFPSSASSRNQSPSSGGSSVSENRIKEKSSSSATKATHDNDEFQRGMTDVDGDKSVWKASHTFHNSRPLSWGQSSHGNLAIHGDFKANRQLQRDCSKP